MTEKIVKESSRERGLRKRAARIGLTILKNRMRKDRNSPHFGRYNLLDTATNGHLTPQDWAELDVVEELIVREEKARAK